MKFKSEQGTTGGIGHLAWQQGRWSKEKEGFMLHGFLWVTCSSEMTAGTPHARVCEMCTHVRVVCMPTCAHKHLGIVPASCVPQKALARVLGLQASDWTLARTQNTVSHQRALSFSLFSVFH